MKKLIRFIATLFSIAVLFHAGSVLAQEAPDVLIKRISQDVLDTAKADKGIQSGNQKRIRALVEAKIIPHVNFERMTSLAVGRYWRDASPEQQKRLTVEFRDLLIHTYSGAIAQIQNQKLQFRPYRAQAADTDVIVYSQVIQSGKEAIQLNYRLENRGGVWKIYDINILGAWLIQTYKGTFATEIGKSGIDGLIKTLSEKNKALGKTA